jgi:hypothetical protein
MISVEFSDPARYRIEVQGLLEQRWLNRLGAMEISTIQTEVGISTIEGDVKDQAELAGILNTLYEMHLPLISVRRTHHDKPGEE